MLKSQENHKMEDKVVQLKQIIEESDNIVFFGGAGVSTESGIPDFRSVDGLYNQNTNSHRKKLLVILSI